MLFFGVSALRDKATAYKDIYVELSFNYRDEFFLIKRKINDATLLMKDQNTDSFEEVVNSTSAVNQMIISMLGYNYDIFLLSNFCQQKKLAYFSELTPAKRLQYIDKISGIEEAKDFFKYLTGLRKELRSNIALLKDVTIEPELPANVDLEFDYENHIKALNQKLNGINVLYNRFNDINNSIITNNTYPINPLTEHQEVYINVSQKTLNSYIEYLASLEKAQNDIYSTKDALDALPRLHKNLRHLTLEQIEEYINIATLNSIKETSQNLNVICPTCNTKHNLNTLLDASHCSPVEYKLSDLYFVQNYIKESYDEKREELSNSLVLKEKILESLITTEPVKGLSSIKSRIELTNLIANLNKKYSKYLDDKQKYEEIETLNKIKLDQAQQLKKEIDDLMASQAADIELKDSYIKSLTERTIFKERLDLYLQAKSKLETFNMELDVVSSSMKDVTAITNNIKNQTIPLINYHASKFLNLISNGSLQSIEITEDYDLIVDGHKISVKSGGQQDLASLAFRLSLSQSIIQGLLPLFLADEIDSAGGENDATDIVQALDTISNNGFQLIIVTHKNTDNLENVNIIQL